MARLRFKRSSGLSARQRGDYSYLLHTVGSECLGMIMTVEQYDLGEGNSTTVRSSTVQLSQGLRDWGCLWVALQTFVTLVSSLIESSESFVAISRSQHTLNLDQRGRLVAQRREARTEASGGGSGESVS